MNTYTPTCIRRFWAKVDFRGLNGCWIWTGARTYGGHGVFWDGRRQQQAHRIAWELLCGPIPDGMYVCHNCPGGDNPSCVRPEHVFLGLPRHNVWDWQDKKQAKRNQPTT